MGLQAEIWAWRLGGGGAEVEKEKKEKIPHMCESIGHRPFGAAALLPPSTSVTIY